MRFAPSEQPVWLIDCDDCGEGPVAWVNDHLEEQGYSVRSDPDSPLDAPSVISKGIFWPTDPTAQDCMRQAATSRGPRPGHDFHTRSGARHLGPMAAFTSALAAPPPALLLVECGVDDERGSDGERAELI